jgi:hypothetical protein
LRFSHTTSVPRVQATAKKAIADKVRAYEEDFRKARLST